jgi:4-hydroxybenzoate polyprenyltransferase
VKKENFFAQFNHRFRIIRSNLTFTECWLCAFKAFKLLNSTSLFIAVNGLAVTAFGLLVYGIALNLNLLFAAFLVTFAVYGLNKFTDKIEDNINRPEISPKVKSFQLVLSVTFMIIGLLIGVLEGVNAFVSLISPVIIGVIYSIKISKATPRLKEIVGVKSVAVGLSWAILGGVLPQSSSTASVEISVLIFVFVFVKVLVGTILCDVLDIKGDAVSGIETVPIRLGLRKTKRVLLILNSLGLFWLLYCINKGLLLQLIPALLFGVLFGYFTIWWFLREKCRRVTASLMLDLEWIPILAIGYLFIA